MFEVRVETTFEAAHSRGPDGAEVSLHHHEWQVAVRARSADLDHIGLVIDFRVLREVADEVVGELDQRVLEEVDAFTATPPTAAAVAEWIFGRLEEHFAASRADADPAHEFRLSAVEVEADAGTRYEYLAASG